MSKVIKRYFDRALATLVEVDCSEYYYVDSAYTLDHGLETMVFKADKTGKVLDWSELYVAHYSTVDEMTKHHEQLNNNLEKYI